MKYIKKIESNRDEYVIIKNYSKLDYIQVNVYSNSTDIINYRFLRICNIGDNIIKKYTLEEAKEVLPHIEKNHFLSMFMIITISELEELIEHINLNNISNQFNI